MRNLGRTRLSGGFELLAAEDVSGEGNPTEERAHAEVMEALIEAETNGSLNVENFGVEPAQLPLIHWVDELVDVTRAVMGGRGSVNKQDARSLAGDIQLALGRLGSTTRLALSVDLERFRSDIENLPAALAKATSARPIFGLACHFRDQLASPSTIRAAWADAADAVRRRDPSPTPFFDLRALVEAFGQDWKTAKDTAQGILHNELRSVKEATGETVTAADVGQQTELSWDERVELVGAWLAKPVERADAHAYITVQGADLPKGYLRVRSGVELYAVRTWHELLVDKWREAPDGWEPPPQLREAFGTEERVMHPLVTFSKVDDPQPPVHELARDDKTSRFTDADGTTVRATAARVPVSAVLYLKLPNMKFSTAKDRALAAAAELLGTAFFESPWTLAGSFFVGLENGSWTRGGFNQPTPPRERVDVTRERLEDMSPELVSAICSEDRDPTIRAALDEQAALHRIAALDDPRQQVVLAARALEHHLPQPVGDERRESWSAAAERYLIDRWVWRTIRRQLRFVLDEAAGHGFLPVIPEVQTVVDTFLTVRGDIHTVNFAVGSRRVRDLAKGRRTGSLAQLEVLEFADILDTPERMSTWIRDLTARAERLFRQTSRIRNSVIHGTFVPLAVAEYIAPFAIEEARHATMTFLEASLIGEDHAVAFERSRAEATQRLQRMCQGEHFSAIVSGT